jgi:hypothetical protein
MPTAHIPSQMQWVHIFQPHFLNFHFKIFLTFMSMFSKWVFSFPVSQRKFYMHLSFLTYSLDAPTVSSLSYQHPNNIRWRAQLMKLLTMQCSRILCLASVISNISLSASSHTASRNVNPNSTTSKTTERDRNNMLLTLMMEGEDQEFA